MSLQKLCFDYTVQKLGAFPPAVLSLLPLTIRQEMLPLMCVADVYRVEASGFTKGMDTSDLWKGFYKKHYDKVSGCFPWKREKNNIDWKEDFSTALGYHALHDDDKLQKVPALGEVLFGGGSGHCLLYTRPEELDFDRVMEIFSYMQFKCKKLVIRFDKISNGFIGDLVHRHIGAKLQGTASGNCRIIKLSHCLDIFVGNHFCGKPVLEMLSSADLQYIIHFSGSGSQTDDVIPLMKQPLFRSIFVDGASNFCDIWKLLICFFLNAAKHEQTFSLSVSNKIISVDFSCKLSCSEGSCKSFLCSNGSVQFYEWFFSNSLALKYLKVCATGTKVLKGLSNLDFQVQHLELDCNCASPPSTAILSIRELQALTLLKIGLTSLCDFMFSALQSKLNLQFLSITLYEHGSATQLDKWNLSELFHLIFSFCHIETFELESPYDSNLLVGILFASWQHCGGRKLRKLTVKRSTRNIYHYYHGHGPNYHENIIMHSSSLEKLNAMAMAVTAK